MFYLKQLSLFKGASVKERYNFKGNANTIHVCINGLIRYGNCLSIFLWMIMQTYTHFAVLINLGRKCVLIIRVNCSIVFIVLEVIDQWWWYPQRNMLLNWNRYKLFHNMYFLYIINQWIDLLKNRFIDKQQCFKDNVFLVSFGTHVFKSNITITFQYLHVDLFGNDCR